MPALNPITVTIASKWWRVRKECVAQGLVHYFYSMHKHINCWVVSVQGMWNNSSIAVSITFISPSLFFFIIRYTFKGDLEHYIINVYKIPWYWWMSYLLFVYVTRWSFTSSSTQGLNNVDLIPFPSILNRWWHFQILINEHVLAFLFKKGFNWYNQTFLLDLNIKLVSLWVVSFR